MGVIMKTALPATRCGNAVFRWGEKTYIMGICNLSPDSFSGDGLGSDIPATVAQAQRMVAEGAEVAAGDPLARLSSAAIAERRVANAAARPEVRT